MGKATALLFVAGVSDWVSAVPRVCTTAQELTFNVCTGGWIPREEVQYGNGAREYPGSDSRQAARDDDGRHSYDEGNAASCVPLS
jgi:hypothetical protein